MDEAVSDRVLGVVHRLMGSGDVEAGAMIANLLGRVKQLERQGPGPRREPRETSRFTGLNSKHDEHCPADARELMRAHGMRNLEWIAGQRGRDEAIRFERQFWLPTLERWLATEEHPALLSYLRDEIKRLRRCLGVIQSPEEKRARTRERVRRHRAGRADAAP